MTTIDILPGKLYTPARADLRRQYLVYYTLRNSGADTSDGTLPAIDADCHADTMAPLYANAVLISKNTARKTRMGHALDDDAETLGTRRLGAEGSGGAIRISASSGGVNILAGQEGVCGGKRFRATTTRIYLDGESVPVAGIDTGPLTVQPAGVSFAWSNPPAGLGPLGTVVQQANGSGLSGGHDAENDDQLRQRLNYLAANPPASGNDAGYQKAMYECPGLSVQAAFTIPCVLGPGTTGLAFTVVPAKPGGNRIPTSTQIATMLAWVTGQMPGDDIILMITLTANPVTLALKTSWAQGVPAWTDAIPWPAYASSLVQVITGGTSVAVTPTTFTLTNITTAPAAGQNLAFYDPIGVFRRKKILTSTLNANAVDYDIVVDQTNGISDTSFAPINGSAVCPWSESLDTLIPAIVGVAAPSSPAPGQPTAPTYGYFDLLGPGEQYASFWDPGLRQRRSPPDPAFWPLTITSRIVLPVYALTSVQDTQIYAPTIPYTTPIGTPGVSAKLTTLKALLAFP